MIPGMIPDPDDAQQTSATTTVRTLPRCRRTARSSSSRTARISSSSLPIIARARRLFVRSVGLLVRVLAPALHPVVNGRLILVEHLVERLVLDRAEQVVQPHPSRVGCPRLTRPAPL